MTGQKLTIQDHYDAELARHNERLRAATHIGASDRVLDIGCGGGQTTRDAARAASSGSVLGVDISDEMLERARRLTAQAGLHNVTYARADAQSHSFEPRHFDVAISRFGTMFFANPVAGFTNLASALRHGARLVMMVWQNHDRNEWAVAIREALMTGERRAPAFSLGDPPFVEDILAKAGFADVGFSEVREPVYYGPDADTAYQIIMSFQGTDDRLAALNPDTRERARQQLRSTLARHETADGVLFDSRAWIVTACRSA